MLGPGGTFAISGAGWVLRTGAHARCPRLTLVLVAAGCASLAAQTPPVEEILLRARPAVVLVSASVGADVKVDCEGTTVSVSLPAHNETGTAWLLDPNGFLITSAHVVQPAHAPEAWRVQDFAERGAAAACVPVWLLRLKLKPGERPDVEERLHLRAREAVAPSAEVTLHPEIHVRLPNGVRLPAEVKKYGRPLGVGAGQTSAPDLALLKVSGRDYPVLPLADSHTVQIGERIHILGYPAVVLTHELLNPSAGMGATVTSGAVSDFKQDVAGDVVIQTDAPAAWGDSGGPALDARGEVVGVLTFISLGPGPDGGIVQGFNFVIPSSAVYKFVAGTEVVLGIESRFNTAWWEGLGDFFHRKFGSATRHFDEADHLLPGLPDVRRMRADATWFLDLSRREVVPPAPATRPDVIPTR